MEFVPNEKATPIRYPSIANLMVDSADRVTENYQYSNDFQINKKNSLLNGFFTRVGATEVVMEWNTPNVSPDYGNNVIEVSINGVVTPGTTTTIPSGFYTVEQALNESVIQLNGISANTGITWTIAAIVGQGAVLTATGAPGTLVGLLGSLFFQLTGGQTIYVIPGAGFKDIPVLASTADLRPTRYIDIVCNQLTNNQAVKDASTADIVRDVLVRWYFAYDNQAPPDGYGFPVLMGYTPFYLRRLYNPPKQIQWQTNIPVGNLSFQLYNSEGTLLPVNFSTNYLMTLQISEN